ncbi:uncharacterized protein LOC128345934 [Hemicordylus capensis]|uniref:uncharacterized protein LOC128345934 n=1 Tax=Hemicordylus capensis TaxID=884348 RepID=UPI0023039855|nr:uncharacterized protein LOC128345934 [Hemicordylus capensis]
MSWLNIVLLLFTGLSVSNENLVIQKPTVILAEEGETVNITCHFRHDVLGLFLLRTLVKSMKVFYVTNGGRDQTFDPNYINRTVYLKQWNTTIIMLQEVQKNDSDVYVCEASFKTEDKRVSKNSSATILAVRAKSTSNMNSTECSSSSWMPYVIFIQSLLLVFALLYFILSCTNIKKYCQKGRGKAGQNMIYEDMSYSLKRSGTYTTNHYQG